MNSTQSISPNIDYSSCLLFDFYTLGLTLSLTSLLGTLGNSLSILTFWPTRNENSTSLLLLTLAMVDIGVLITHTVMISPGAFCKYLGSCMTYMNFTFHWMTAYFWPFGSSFHLASTWLVVLVTFNRFIGVCHPHKFKSWMSVKMMKIQIIIIGAGSFVYNLPRFFDDWVKLSPDGTHFDIYLTKLGSSEVFGYFYNVALYYIVIYVIPFSGLIYMSVCLAKAIKDAKAKRAQMTRAKKDEHDLTLSLVIVVIVYMICQILNPIRRVLFAAIPSSSYRCGNPIIFVTSLGIIINSSINFVIYCIFSPRFRRQLKGKLRNFNAVAPVAPIPNSVATRSTGADA